ncbi:ABC transporter permease [Corynebacterium sp. HMSC29G08]|uniref:ABC transporter permease n=1 Tax=Corynebacterium sp. HMSC29G08 TaxID=1581069 RepID=UPI000A40ED57|nr:ABC transporter permease [Corynebacterium sp. HMSC29G08]
MDTTSDSQPIDSGGSDHPGAAPSVVVDTRNLHSLQSRPGFIEYCRQLWARRAFIWADARFKALRTTKDYRLWRTWLVLQPLLDVAFYAFLFGLILKTSRGIDNFIGFLILGVIFMRMITGQLSQGIMLIRNSRGMIQTFTFPRASLAISQTLRSLLDNILPAVIAVIMALAVQNFSPLSWSALLVIPLFFLIHIFGCGLTLITARLTAVLPDTRALIDFFSKAWFFLSGVMFSIERFVDHPVMYDAMTANPAYIFLTAIRGSVLYDAPPSIGTWITLLAWSFGTLCVGMIYFWQAEARYVRLT